MAASYGFPHLAPTFESDFRASVRFLGGVVTHAGMPALPTTAPYTILAWCSHPGGLSGQIYNAGSNFGINNSRQLVVSGVMASGMTLPLGNWWTGALTFDGGTVTTIYQDGEIGAVSGVNPVAFTGGAASTTLGIGGNMSQLIVIPGVCLTQDQIRAWHYQNADPAAGVNLRMREAIGTALGNSGSLGGTTHTMGVNTSWTPDVPKMPAVFSIDSGSMLFDGSANSHLTPNAAGLTALGAVLGGPGIGMLLWLKTAPGNDGARYPVAMSNGTTLLRAIADAAGLGNFQWSNIRANASSAVTNAVATPRRRSVGQWVRMGVSVDNVNGVIETFADRVIQTRDQNAAHIAPSWYGGSSIFDLRLGAGAANAANSNWFGRLADVCLFRRPLTAQDVFSDWVGRTPTPDVRWRFRSLNGSLTPGEGIAANMVVAPAVSWSTEGPRS
jgi:hypothetical protein